MLTLTITYPASGHMRVHTGLSQAEVNVVITQLSQMHDAEAAREDEPPILRQMFGKRPFVPVRVTVTEDQP